jgi:hypothetical protein
MLPELAFRSRDTLLYAGGVRNPDSRRACEQTVEEEQSLWKREEKAPEGAPCRKPAGQ